MLQVECLQNGEQVDLEFEACMITIVVLQNFGYTMFLPMSPMSSKRPNRNASAVNGVIVDGHDTSKLLKRVLVGM